MRVIGSRMKLLVMVFVIILFGGALTSLLNLWPSSLVMYEAWFRSSLLFGLALFLVISRFFDVQRLSHALPIGRVLYVIGALLLSIAFVILGVSSLRFYIYNINPPIEITTLQFGLIFAGIITSIIGQLLLPEVTGITVQPRTLHGWRRTIGAALISSFILFGLLFVWISFS